MGRDENVKIFNDTKKMCRTNEKLVRSIEFSCKWQRVVLEKDRIIIRSRKIYREAARVVVSGKRSFEAASAYKGQKVCVHNFASATSPGGGVTRGKTAQEEALCRISTLYFCLNREEVFNTFYKPHKNEKNLLNNDDLVYTPNVTVFKTDTLLPHRLPEEEWYRVNVITCAAPNLKEQQSNLFNQGDGIVSVQINDRELLLLHEKRLRRILDTALRTGNEVVILGAFGCGTLENDPRIVAQAAKNVIPDYLYAFRTIEFAIYCSPQRMINYKIFEKAFSRCSKSF